ncbi:MAG: 1-acyl-sn-glycerol-3-phosphate acyltransferase [Treponema sp.]|nr:1-acyl-sn-glycerol-3-phosphate acyltransferase [Treponema sp.]
MAHQDEYTEQDRYDFIRYFAAKLKKNAHIFTHVYGLENLPKEGGYVMYPNHQGKYDAIGIFDAHKNPCTIVVDAKRSKLLLVDQMMRVLDGVRLDSSSIRNQIEGIQKVYREVSNGRRYIIFPEGGYKDNRNNVQEFKPGAFKCAIKAKSPIVPVALIDSWKPFTLNSLRRVETQIHFLEPLNYDDYKDLSTQEIAEQVRTSIVNKIAACL